MPKSKLKLPTDLGFGNTDQKAVTVDDFDYEGFEIVLPPVTFDIIKQYDFDHEILESSQDEKFWNALPLNERDALIDEFTDSTGWHEWRDSFNPMMLYYWPLFLHGSSAEHVAELMDEFAPNCSLLRIEGDSLRQTVGEDYAIVLTGGGMDLSDNLAAAYLCAGSVPPIELLKGLSNTVRGGKVKTLGPPLRVAYRQAKAALRSDIERLDRESKAVFRKAA